MTKKRNRISAGLTEACTVVYDSTRQPSYEFNDVRDGVMELAEKYEKLKAIKKMKKRKFLEQQLEELNDDE